MSDSDASIIQVDLTDGIAVVTMNQPERRNAFSMAMRLRMYDQVLALEHNEECRAIIVTGAGGHFCSGGDISEMRQRPLLEGRMRFDLPTKLFRLLIAGNKPYITAVEGSCAGCGVSLVAASDFSIAASNAKFSCAFVKMGLMPDIGGIWAIPRKIGHRRAMELCMLGEPIDGREAERIQLVNRVCEPGKALDEARELARKLARNPPIAMALLRAALNIGADTADQAATTEINFQSLLMNTADHAEAARAYKARETPVFKGR